MARRWVRISAHEAQAHPLYGIKGWLAFFVIANCLMSFASLGAVLADAEKGGVTHGELWDHALGTMTTIYTAILAALTLLWMASTKDRHFRPLALVVVLGMYPYMVALQALLDDVFAAETAATGFFGWVLSSLVLGAVLAPLGAGARNLQPRSRSKHARRVGGA